MPCATVGCLAKMWDPVLFTVVLALDGPGHSALWMSALSR